MTVLCISHNDELGRTVLEAARAAAAAIGTDVVVAISPNSVPDFVSAENTVTLPENQDEADAILDLAVARNASLLVVGIRRRSPVGKFLLGSSAQRLILEAEIPVLTTKESHRD